MRIALVPTSSRPPLSQAPSHLILLIEALKELTRVQALEGTPRTAGKDTLRGFKTLLYRSSLSRKKGRGTLQGESDPQLSPTTAIPPLSFSPLSQPGTPGPPSSPGPAVGSFSALDIMIPRRRASTQGESDIFDPAKLDKKGSGGKKA